MEYTRLPCLSIGLTNEFRVTMVAHITEHLMDRSKVGKRSRRKGASFERDIARVFSAWLGCNVRRTPMSGAYGGEWNLGGDLMFEATVPW